MTISNGRSDNWTIWACYCPAERSQRSEFWEILVALIKNGSNSCACITYFNKVMDQNEKLGSREVSTRHNFLLKNFLEDAQGMDIGFNGNTFTWCNKRGRLANIENGWTKLFLLWNGGPFSAMQK